ncbi:hypothetical protein K3495_g1689 [Podosphaera aphanis]|nr:hypothetical protein K3495_g1689 [Podosphaera aphanis]
MFVEFSPCLRRLLLFILFSNTLTAFYIPGWSVKTYRENQAIPLLVNKVYSDNTQLQFAYYSLPFVCPPSGKNHAGSSFLSGQTIPLNLGEVLRGDRIQQSDVELIMEKDYECNFLCNHTVSGSDIKRAQKLIKEGYVAEWIVDNLPGATSFVTVDKSSKYYTAGFKLGFTEYLPALGKTVHYLNNHVTIVILYRKATGRAGEKGEKVIVGFEIYTKSIGIENRRSDGCPLELSNVTTPFELGIHGKNADTSAFHPQSSYHLTDNESEIDDEATLDIPYTYSVYWRENDKIDWAHRWDMYFMHQDAGSKVHWLAIINSLIITGLLSAIVAIILAKTIRADLKACKEVSAEHLRLRAKREFKNGHKPSKFESKELLVSIGDEGNDADISSDEEFLEDQSGWKLLPGDVFRTPIHGSFLAHLIGSGMQLVFMVVGLLLLSSLGILNPSFRGSFGSASIGLFISAGVFSGYFSGRLYKTFGGLNWRKNAVITALLFPGLLFTLVFILNLFVWAQASSTALPFGTLVAIVMLWLCIQLPLVYMGSWYGYSQAGTWEHPIKPSITFRQVPPQAWYLQNPQSILIAGLIPFAVIFVELIFVFQSLWQDKSSYYYVFGFLSIASIILIATIAEVTIVAIYVKLCSEDYNWWWQSFAVGSGSSIWVFAFCIWYYFTKLHIDGFVSSLLFFSYSAIACMAYGLLCGTVGFLTAYTFVRRMYGAIKAD